MLKLISELGTPKPGTKILAVCLDNIHWSRYGKDSKLTPYGCYAEYNEPVCDGIHVLEFVEGDYETSEIDGEKILYPDWWFLSANPDMPANPIAYIELPIDEITNLLDSFKVILSEKGS